MDNLAGVLQSLPGFLQIVNIVVLLSALFFFTSTIASHLVEVWVGWRNSRGKSLRDGLETALGKEVTDAIYKHPLINSLASGKDHPPSYMEPEFFARVAAKLFNDATSLASKSEVLKAIKDTLAATPAEFEPKIIEWFKAVNDRQTGVYTRWTFLRLIVIGFLFAATMDIDTVHIAGTLWNNPEQAKNAADALAATDKFSGKDFTQLSADEQKALQASVAKAVQQLRTIAPPNYAWQNSAKFWPPSQENWKDCLAKLLGWLLTALATSLGAQFWFNIMSEALKLRAAGRKPDDDPKKKKDADKNLNGSTSATVTPTVTPPVVTPPMVPPVISSGGVP